MCIYLHTCMYIYIRVCVYIYCFSPPVSVHKILVVFCPLGEVNRVVRGVWEKKY